MFTNQYSFKSGHLKTVKWLVEKDVSVTILNNSAETAYEVAKRNGHIEIANYLAEPSGIKTQITIDDYVSLFFIKIISKFKHKKGIFSYIFKSFNSFDDSKLHSSTLLKFFPFFII